MCRGGSKEVAVRLLASPQDRQRRTNINRKRGDREPTRMSEWRCGNTEAGALSNPSVWPSSPEHIFQQSDGARAQPFGIKPLDHFFGGLKH
ncbi:hypothetical protein ACVWZL_001315 [Bradyrhizobium sp. GM2.4]